MIMNNLEIAVIVILFVLGSYLTFNYEENIITAAFGGCLFASVIGSFLNRSSTYFSKKGYCIDNMTYGILHVNHISQEELYYECTTSPRI
jgi:hypothetical protein